MRKLSAILLLSALAFPALAQEIDTPEIESTKGRTVEFVNYVGPHDRIDTLEAIKDIGASMGAAVASGANTAGGSAKYYLIHAVDPAVETGFDADILVLGPDAQVDHVDNLRWIIAGFLSAAYGYSEADARTLAFFITVYNAVYRSDLEYFKTRYKKIVMDNLPADSAGLALRWDEWAGKTRIVIPLSSRKGGQVSGVDTGSITDEKTITSVRDKEEDRGIDERRDVVDLKERELEKEKADIEKEKARIAEEERKLAEEKAKAEDKTGSGESGSSDSSTESGSTTGEGGDKTGGSSDSGSGESGTMTSTEIAEKEKELEKAKEDVAEREAAVAEKEKEVAEERESIAADTKEVIKDEIAAAKARTIVLVQAVDKAYPYGRLVAVDIDTGKIVRTSDLNTIRARTLVDDGKQFVVIAGRSEGTGAVRLVALDRNTLKQVDEGTDDIYPESWLWNTSAGLFAVIVRDGKTYLAKFSTTLDVIAVSEIVVDPLTFLVVNDLGVIVQSAGGAFVILDPKDLKLIKEIGK